MRSLALSACCLVAGAWCSFAADTSIRVLNPPDELVEGRAFKLVLKFELPDKLGRVRLHCELKNPKHIVLKSQAVVVQGAGTREFEFTAPQRSQEKEVLFAAWFGEDWRKSIGPIVHTDTVSIVTPEVLAMQQARHKDAEAWAQQHGKALREGSNVALLADDLPGMDQRLVAAVHDKLKSVGLNVVPLDARAAANEFILDPERFQLLVLTNSAVFPATGDRAIRKFLRGGGDIIALGAPAFTTPVAPIGDEWLSEEQIRERLAQVKPEHILIDFEQGGLEGWHRSTNRPESPSKLSIEQPGAAGSGRCLHAHLPDFTGWDNWSPPKLTRPFPADHSLTTFWAKGGPDTTSLAVEWREQDGSRWIATVPLSTEWRHYAVAPYEFRYWHDSPTKNRGGAGDEFRPEHAASLSIGLATTHTRIRTGEHDFWLDQIGTARNPFGPLPRPAEFAVPPVEMLTPGYKFYPVTTAARLATSDKQCLLENAVLPLPDQIGSVHARPQATGYHKERKWRFIPLLEAFDRSGEVVGTPAALVLHRTGRYAQAAIASFAFPNQDFYLQKPLPDLIAALARRMVDGAFLWEGGAEYYAYFPGEPVRLGARVAELGSTPAGDQHVRFTVMAEGRSVFERSLPVRDHVAECVWQPGRFDSDTYQVTVEYLVGDSRRDLLRHELLVWRPKQHPEYLQVRDGDFYLHGQKWYAHGTNYMPSSEIGIEDGEYFEYWLDPQPYDPVVIQRDLQRVKAMGMNMVSIFCYYRSLQSRNLLDILTRCRRLGLMVNLSLRPGTPLDFRWEEMKALIEAYRLAENDTVFAYDLAWEPHWRGYNQRKRWDGAWEKWIIERYGSLANAEADWKMPAPRAEGKVTGPSDEQITKDGPWRVMVAAYRRFLDDLLDQAHARANGLVKSIDPHHLTSFRMSIAGDPTANPVSMGYDFRGLARTVDIMEPEGYGRIGDWERVKPGRFTAAYAHCVAPGRPVLWAEFGYSVWDRGVMAPDAKRMEFAGRFYEDFFQMVLQSGANGTVNWFYPGGYRYGERSDYGIISPDGSWRPTSRAIRKYARQITAPRERKQPTKWLAIDRDQHVDGLRGIYREIESQFWEAIEAGEVPGLRTPGFGLTSATAPPVAVGNTPYTGKNPHKFLNAAFDRIEIREAAGKWTALESGATVKVRAGAPVLCRARIGNNGEATWLAGDQEGAVFLSCREPSTIRFRRPLPRNVAYMETIDLPEFQLAQGITKPETVVFELTALNRAWFGRRVLVQLEPRH